MDQRILVLDGNQRAALAAVRSLGSKLLTVAVGETSVNSLAGSSRYCTERISYSDPTLAPRAFMDDILSQIRKLGITFLLPITEATAYVLLKYRQELPDSVTLPFPDSDIVERVANKNELFRLALQRGIPVPETLECQNSSEGLEKLKTVHKFPIVLKPAKSKILLEECIVSTQVIIAKTRQEAEEALKAHSFFSFPFTMQAFVEGQGQGVFALFNHGHPVCYFAHRRLREKPPGGGVSVLSESAMVTDSLRAHTEELLCPINWHGVAMVEFRMSDNGTPYLMEINPRFWGSLQLAIDSGIDFPWLLFLVSTGQPLPNSVWKHRRVRWLLGDLDRLYLVLKAPTATYSVGEKILELLRFLKPGLRTRHEVNRWRDLRPFWFELKQYLHALKN